VSKDKTRPTKQPKNKTVTVPQRNKKDVIYSICVFIAVCALIFYPPYVRGLFFSEDMFLFHILTAIVLVLVVIDKISRKDYAFLQTPLDWAVAAYAGAYLLSLLGAVHFGEAVYGFLKALNYFLIYWMVSSVVKNYADYKNMMRVIVLTGTGVAVIGLLAATGYSSYPAAFDGKYILSTMQYRNATGAYLLVTTLIGATLWLREPNKFLRPLYATASFLMILVILATFSKGSWLVILLAMILLFIGMPGKFRIRTVYIFAVSGAAALLTAIKFLPAITGNNAANALPYLFIGLFIVAVGELLWDRLAFSKYLKKIPINAKTGTLIVLCVLILGIGMSGNQIVKALEGTSLVTQFSNLMNTSDPSFVLRNDHYRWGWAIFKDYPINGTGAGGWNALYHQYQDYLFWTTEVHNHFLQVMVETGIIGLFAFLSMWVFLLLPIYRRWQSVYIEQQTEDLDDTVDKWILNWGITVAVLAGGAHAAIDFDLSLGAIAVLLWTLFALANAGARLDQYYVVKPAVRPWLGLTIVTILTIVLLIAGQRMSAAHNLFTYATGMYNQTVTMNDTPERENKINEVINAVSQAKGLDPFNSNYSAVLVQSRSMSYVHLKNEQNPAAANTLRQIQADMQRTLQLSPQDIKIRAAMLNACLMIQDFDGALRQSQAFIKMNPYDVNAYNTMIGISVAAAEQKFKAQDTVTGAGYLKNAIEIGQKMEKQKLRINPARRNAPYWNGAPLILSPDSQLSLAKAHFLLGNYSQAEQITAALIQEQPNMSAQIQPWYLASMYKSGKLEENQPAIQSLRNSDPQAAAMFDNLCKIAPLAKP